MDYSIYHDESKENGYWHGILLVPENTRGILFQYLESIRQNTKYRSTLSLKNVKYEGRVLDCAESWVLCSGGAMMSRFGKNKFQIRLGNRDKGRPKWEGNYEDIVKFPIGAKFILFREKDSHSKMSDLLDHGGKIETTLRMGLKGGLHFLGSKEEPINIVKIHFDGYEHYGRSIDQCRLIEKISGLRDYCSFSKDIKYLIDDRTSNHDKENCQDYKDCQFLQLTDLLVGSFRVAFKYTTNIKGLHERVAEPVKYLVDKYNEGYARMQNSRWKNSFCMSQCSLHDGQWIFEVLEPAIRNEKKQIELF